MPKLETRAEFEARYSRTTNCCDLAITAHPIFGSHFLGCPHCGWEVGTVAPHGLFTPDGEKLLHEAEWVQLPGGTRYRIRGAWCCPDCVESAIDNAKTDADAEAIEAEHGEDSAAFYLEVAIGDDLAQTDHLQSAWCAIHADGGPAVTPRTWTMRRDAACYGGHPAVAHTHLLGPFWPDTPEADFAALAADVAKAGQALYASVEAKNKVQYVAG